MRGRNGHMLHEFVKAAHMVTSKMRGLRYLVTPALGNPDKAGNSGVFGQAILQASVERLYMRGMQD